MGSTDKKYGNRVILVQIFKKYENHTFSVDKTGEKEKKLFRLYKIRVFTLQMVFLSQSAEIVFICKYRWRLTRYCHDFHNFDKCITKI